MSLVIRRSRCRRFGRVEHTKSSAVAEMGDHLAAMDLGRKVEGLLFPIMWGGAGMTQCHLGQGLPRYQVMS